MDSDSLQAIPGEGLAGGALNQTSEPDSHKRGTMAAEPTAGAEKQIRRSESIEESDYGPDLRLQDISAIFEGGGGSSPRRKPAREQGSKWISMDREQMTPEEENVMRALNRKGKQTFGFPPKEWQAMMSASMIGGRDIAVVAGCGSGKSLVFQMVTQMEKSSVLVISPLKLISHQQAECMNEMGIKAIALTEDTLLEDPEIWTKLKREHVRIVYASPEILLSSGSPFWRTIAHDHRRCTFIKHLKAIAIDEAHCIWKWGESGFRPEYKNLGTLRALFPKVPIGVFSATMVPTVLSYVHTSLGMNNPSYIYQQTTSRDNISLVVARIKHPKSYKDLDFVIGKGITARWQIPKTMIFIDDCSETVAMAQYLRALLPAALSPDSVSIVRSYHGHLEGLTREDIIESMQEGDCRIIVCTEACGMGLDLADIRRTLIWKVEKHLTLAELWQRSGRCVRDRSLMGVAILFVEDKHILSQDNDSPSKSGLPFFGFQSPCLPDQKTTEFRNNLILSRGNSPISKIDPGVAWYINTHGCRRKCILFQFNDLQAFDEADDLSSCCDNCALANSSAPDEPATLQGFSLTDSLKYEYTVQFKESQIQQLLANSQIVKETRGRPTPAAMKIACLKNLIALRSSLYNSTDLCHRQVSINQFFPRTIMDLISAKCMRIESLSDLQREIGSEVPLQYAPIGEYVFDILQTLESTRNPRPVQGCPEFFDSLPPVSYDALCGISPSPLPTPGLPQQDTPGNDLTVPSAPTQKSSLALPSTPSHPSSAPPPPNISTPTQKRKRIPDNELDLNNPKHLRRIALRDKRIAQQEENAKAIAAKALAKATQVIELRLTSSKAVRTRMALPKTPHKLTRDFHTQEADNKENVLPTLPRRSRLVLPVSKSRKAQRHPLRTSTPTPKSPSPLPKPQLVTMDPLDFSLVLPDAARPEEICARPEEICLHPKRQKQREGDVYSATYLLTPPSSPKSRTPS